MIIRRRIKLSRSWSSDQDNNCNVSHPNRHPSVLNLDSKVTLCVEDKDVKATFTGLLEFICGDLGEPTTSEADVIQRIFYDDGGCGGQFEMLSERDHAHDACPSEEAAFIRAAIDYANDSYLQPLETAFPNYLEQP